MNPDGRLTWNHDDAEGGMTAAAIEKEAATGHVTDPSVSPSVSREWTAEDFARAEFARHPQSGRIAARLRPEKMWAWTAGRDEERLRDDQMMAGWVPVQETQPDEQPSFSDFLGRLSVAGSEAEEARKDAQFWQARWKEAVDRADARDDAAYRWKEATREHVRRIRTVKSYVEALQGGIDQEKARAEKAEQERDSWESIAQQTARSIDALRAEQPRPLTADAIESVLHDILPLTANRLGEDDIASIASDLYLALTAPARDPRAEEIQADLAAAEEPEMDDEDRRLIADHLAARGYRKAES